MKLPALALFALLTVATAPDVYANNGRQPCDRGAGGISHCRGDKFICNNGRVSGSKRVCDPKVHGTAPKTTGKGKPLATR